MTPHPEMLMRHAEDVWAIVLAAGDGARVRELSLDDEGFAAPKQFCRFGTDRSLLGHAMARVANVAAPARTVVVVAEGHRAWWERELREHPPRNVVAQPRNRGTAAGLLLPLLRVLARHPRPIVVVAPSDHIVEDESALLLAIKEAVRAVRARPRSTVLLGMVPDGSDGEFGWIVPREPPRRATVPIRFFVEKPSRGVAAALSGRGALRNSFLLVSRGDTLLGLFRKTRASLVDAFVSASGPAAAAGPPVLERLYNSLDESDFSRDVLARAAEDLEVLPVPACGWRDLGTPAAIAEWIERRLVGAKHGSETARERRGP